jgi:hypothetical protein
MWERVDVDGSGSLGVEELSMIMVEIGRPLTRRQLEAVVRSIDADGSGQVSETEFEDWYREQLRTDWAALPAASSPLPKPDTQLAHSGRLITDDGGDAAEAFFGVYRTSSDTDEPSSPESTSTAALEQEHTPARRAPHLPTAASPLSTMLTAAKLTPRTHAVREQFEQEVSTLTSELSALSVSVSEAMPSLRAETSSSSLNADGNIDSSIEMRAAAFRNSGHAALLENLQGILLDSSVSVQARNTPFVEPFLYRNDLFAKTGSRQI